MIDSLQKSKAGEVIVFEKKLEVGVGTIGECTKINRLESIDLALVTANKFVQEIRVLVKRWEDFGIPFGEVQSLAALAPVVRNTLVTRRLRHSVSDCATSNLGKRNLHICT